MESISIHSPLAGRDQDRRAGRAAGQDFNPLAPRGARRLCGAQLQVREEISIHSPLAGRDGRCYHSVETYQSISIHSPLAGRDDKKPGTADPNADFNPLAPRGARHRAMRTLSESCKFQSTRPSRGETVVMQVPSIKQVISIHSPLAGRDGSILGRENSAAYFNPLAPRGARPTATSRANAAAEFQSTRPSRGETKSYTSQLPTKIFQSTRPSRGETGRVRKCIQ